MAKTFVSTLQLTQLPRARRDTQRINLYGFREAIEMFAVLFIVSNSLESLNGCRRDTQRPCRSRRDRRATSRFIGEKHLLSADWHQLELSETLQGLAALGCRIEPQIRAAKAIQQPRPVTSGQTTTALTQLNGMRPVGFLFETRLYAAVGEPHPVCPVTDYLIDER